MPLLSKEAIFAAAEPFVDVPVPEWGGRVRVRTLSAAARDQLNAWATTQRESNKTLAGLRARIVALCAIGEDGKPIFAEADIPAIDARSTRAIDRIVDAAERLNGLTPAAVAELEKNSGAGPSGASPSA